MFCARCAPVVAKNSRGGSRHQKFHCGDELKDNKIGCVAAAGAAVGVRKPLLDHGGQICIINSQPVFIYMYTYDYHFFSLVGSIRTYLFFLHRDFM
jgi:hypothetical protein